MFHFVSVSYSYLSGFVFEDVYGYVTVNLSLININLHRKNIVNT